VTMTESNANGRMQLVEQHIIDRSDPRWSKIDAASFLSKNLYNAANYLLRQEYIFNQRYIPYGQLDKLMKHNPNYCALPRKASQWVLKQVNHDWQAFFAALAEWDIHPQKFRGRPRLPQYKHKTAGRNLLTYTVQAVGKRVFQQKGLLQPSQLDITVQTQQKSFDQVRIIPRKTHYVVEVVYTLELEAANQLDPTCVAGLDIGLNNLAAVTSNQPGFVPFLVNGRPLKALNQGFNKEKARLQSRLPKGQYTSKRIQALTDKRNRQVKQYLHTASHRIIERLLEAGIGTLIIGKNDGWKQAINLGKRTNQNFVFIPYAQFIDMLTYKAQLAGMQVFVTEESYTSKCSFLDGEAIEKHIHYAGRRMKRGLFVASDGRTINADVNGSYNIIRKVIPDAWAGKGIGGAVVHPVRLTPAKHS
jgi:putative transposase